MQKEKHSVGTWLGVCVRLEGRNKTFRNRLGNDNQSPRGASVYTLQWTIEKQETCFQSPLSRGRAGTKVCSPYLLKDRRIKIGDMRRCVFLTLCPGSFLCWDRDPGDLRYMAWRHFCCGAKEAETIHHFIFFWLWREQPGPPRVATAEISLQFFFFQVTKNKKTTLWLV